MVACPDPCHTSSAPKRGRRAANTSDQAVLLADITSSGVAGHAITLDDIGEG
jgi:hypothetical protein